jgi:hypothetical protein
VRAVLAKSRPGSHPVGWVGRSCMPGGCRVLSCTAMSVACQHVAWYLAIPHCSKLSPFKLFKLKSCWVDLLAVRPASPPAGVCNLRVELWTEEVTEDLGAGAGMAPVASLQNRALQALQLQQDEVGGARPCMTHVPV